MAKYALFTMVSYEDNEAAADAQQQQKFVEDWAEHNIEYWHSASVKMVITEGSEVKEYQADADGGPTHESQEHKDRPRHQWPWMKATLLMPETGRNVVVYHDETDFMCFGMLRAGEDNPVKNDNQPWFHCYTNDGQEVAYFQPEFEHLWWRTVEKPLMER